MIGPRASSIFLLCCARLYLYPTLHFCCFADKCRLSISLLQLNLTESLNLCMLRFSYFALPKQYRLVSHAACSQEEGCGKGGCAWGSRTPPLLGRGPLCLHANGMCSFGHPLLCSLTHTRKILSPPSPPPLCWAVTALQSSHPHVCQALSHPHPLLDHWEWPAHSFSSGMNVTALSSSSSWFTQLLVLHI